MDDKLHNVLNAIDALKAVKKDGLENISEPLLRELQSLSLTTANLINKELFRTMPRIGPCPDGE